MTIFFQPVNDEAANQPFHLPTYQATGSSAHQRISLRLYLKAFFLAAVILLSGNLYGVMAADNHLITSLAAIYEYNDNIRLNEDEPLADSIYTIAPKLELMRRSEHYTVQADGMIEFYRYQDYDVFDDMDQWYNGRIEATPTERWQVGAEAHVSDDNRPDRDIATTGQVLSSDNRKRFNAGASAYYTFSEMLTTGILLDFNQENWDDPEISDRKDFGTVLTVSRRIDGWLARTSGRLNLGYRHYEFKRDFEQTDNLGIFDVTTLLDDRTKVDNVSLTAGTDSALTERMDLIVDLGGRFDRSQRELVLTRTYAPPFITEPPVRTDATNDAFGFVGKVNLSYRGERSRCNLLLSHDLAPASGQNATVNRTTVRLGGNMRLREHLRGNLFAQWYRNESDADDVTQDDINTQTWNVGGGLRWRLNDYFDLSANYTYTLVDNLIDDTTAYRNRVLITLDAHYDWLD